MILGVIFGFFSHVKIKGDDSEAVYIPDDVIELFMNNISALGLIALGFFTFGLLTILLLLYNGTFIGLSIAESLSNGTGMGEILIKIIPHGLFEIPAIMISGVVGLKSLELLINMLVSKSPLKELIIRLIKEVIFLTIIIVILIFIASFVEIYITP